jgi:tyrosyl-tRNA synthetase
MGQPPQQILMVPLLVGTDGVQKMSKSLGNYIGITESAEDIYGKTMSVKDEVVLLFMETLTDIPETELAEFKRQTADGANPMGLKKRLARELVTQLYNTQAAQSAEEYFEKTVQNKEIPDEIEEYKISDSITLSRLLVDAGLAKSRSEAGRLVQQGAVTMDGVKASDMNLCVNQGVIIKVGKRRYLKTI